MDAIVAYGSLIIVYFGFMPQYPLTLWEWAHNEPWKAGAWIIIGVGGIVVFRRISGARFLKPFIAVWFMPGVLICGAAGLWPWPVTLEDTFGPAICSNVLSAGICLGLNFLVVFGVIAVWRKFRRWRSAPR
jgi:hypothetical protein